MIPEGNRQSNVARFSGFGHHYDRYRPEAPKQVIGLLTRYLRRDPELVVDIGCGTGLSTFIWAGHAEQIIGVEPNEDMRAVALEKWQNLGGSSDISFINGYSNQLDLASESVDVITCSQSFHWMEPVSTLQEAGRVLKEEGIFAVYDCDWPPALDWRIEQQYNHLIEQADVINARLTPAEERAEKRDKNGHLGQLEQSGVFRFTRELVFHNIEACDAERYIGILVSQGGIQTVSKLGSHELADELEQFKLLVSQYFAGETLDIPMSYRMRLGIK